MTATVTVTLALLKQIGAALHTAIDVNVAVQEICKTSDDGISDGQVYAIASCIEKQEALICPASEALRRALEVAHG